MKKEEMGINFGNDNTEDLMRLAVKEASKLSLEELEILSVMPPKITNEHNMLLHPDPMMRDIYMNVALNDPVIR